MSRHYLPCDMLGHAWKTVWRSGAGLIDECQRPGCFHTRPATSDTEDGVGR